MVAHPRETEAGESVRLPGSSRFQGHIDCCPPNNTTKSPNGMGTVSIEEGEQPHGSSKDCRSDTGALQLLSCTVVWCIGNPIPRVRV